MNTEELLVHQSCQGETVEGLHAGVVHVLRVLDLALLLEGEVLCQVPALVVASQEEESAGVTHLQCPQIQDALENISSLTDGNYFIVLTSKRAF